MSPLALRCSLLFCCLFFVYGELWAQAEIPDELRGQFTVKARYVIGKARDPLVDGEVTLYSVHGLHRTVTKLASGITDAEGRCAFPGMARPREEHFQFLDYQIVVKSEGYETVCSNSFFHRIDDKDIPTFVNEKVGVMKGLVEDELGQPIEGATVSRWRNRDAEALGLKTFTTKKNGAFLLQGIGVNAKNRSEYGVSIQVDHPDFPKTSFQRKNLKFTKLVLKRGCEVIGRVWNVSTRSPLTNARVIAVPDLSSRNVNKHEAKTDDKGNFRFVLPEATFHIMIETEGNAWVAKAVKVECIAGKKIELKNIQASGGGMIEGQVVNTRTKQPQPLTYISEDHLKIEPNAKPEPVRIGLTGPGRPARAQGTLVIVNKDGRFRLRVAPGPNFPYLLNLRGERMSWTTNKVAPVNVREGRVTKCVMKFTPEPTTKDKIAVGRAVLAALPADPKQRVDGIIEEFRKLNDTVDQCEVWCLLMKELKTIGPGAVPALCAELDATDSDRMLRRLSFALRAIGDPNAVPALIRALPKTLQPGSSDYALIVMDPELAAFMRTHQIKAVKNGGRGFYFSFSRCVRELNSSLHRLTGHQFGEPELANIILVKDKRAAATQRLVYHKRAEQWAEWWNENSYRFDVHEENRTMKMPEFVPPDLSDYPTGLNITTSAELAGGLSEMVLTPVGDTDQTASFFLDLDLGRSPSWPKQLLPNDRSLKTISEARKWATDRRLDLMCVNISKDEARPNYVLSGVDLQLWEVDPRDVKKISEFLKRGELPARRQLTSNHLLHLNEQGDHVSTKQSCFLYVTREQGLGFIRITDFVLEARDISGSFSVPEGVGFYRGVRFDWMPIAR